MKITKSRAKLEAYVEAQARDAAAIAALEGEFTVPTFCEAWLAVLQQLPINIENRNLP